MYRRSIGNELIIVGVYVNNLVITRSRTKSMLKFKQEMSTKFDMIDLGMYTYYLGIEVCQKKNEILITQEGYVKKITKKFNHV